MYVYIKGKMNITAQIQMTFTSAQGALFVHIQGYIPNILRQIDAAELIMLALLLIRCHLEQFSQKVISTDSYEVFPWSKAHKPASSAPKVSLSDKRGEFWQLLKMNVTFALFVIETKHFSLHQRKYQLSFAQKCN